VQQSFPGGWKTLGAVTSDKYGIFQRRFSTTRVGSIRGRLVAGGEQSIPFSLKSVPDQFFNPFGSETLIYPGHR
jgi:hypothetical protein